MSLARRPGRRWRAGLAGLLLLAPALAAAGGRLAILPLGGDGVAPERLAQMTGRVREGAVEPAWNAGLAIQDLPGGCDGDGCEVELARSAGAALVLAGRVRRSPAGVDVELNLRETTNGQLAATRTCEGATEVDVLGQLAATTEQLLLAGFARSLARPVRIAAAEPTEREFRWRRSGWSVAATMGQEFFQNGALARHAGAVGGVRIGAGLLGLRVGAYVPGAEPAVGIDLLHDAGLAWRESDREEYVLLVADVEAILLPVARYQRNGVLGERSMDVRLLRIGLPGFGLRYGKLDASLRPSVAWWTFGATGRYFNSVGYELTVGTAF